MRWARAYDWWSKLYPRVCACAAAMAPPLFFAIVATVTMAPIFFLSFFSSLVACGRARGWFWWDCVQCTKEQASQREKSGRARVGRPAKVETKEKI